MLSSHRAIAEKKSKKILRVRGSNEYKKRVFLGIVWSLQIRTHSI